MLDPLHIRQEALPGDHYVVLRGGSRTFDLDHVRDHAAEMFDRHGILGLSVFVVPRDHLEELFVHHEIISRWAGKPVMVSRIRILHQAGFCHRGHRRAPALRHRPRGAVGGARGQAAWLLHRPADRTATELAGLSVISDHEDMDMRPALTLDLMRRTQERLHWTRASKLPDTARVGGYLLVSDGDEVTAVARIVSIDERWTHLDVLPGPAEQHMHLLASAA